MRENKEGILNYLIIYLQKETQVMVTVIQKKLGQFLVVPHVAGFLLEINNA